MSTTIALVVRPRGKPIKNLPEETTVGREDSAAELYKLIAASSKISVHRLKITKGSDGSAIPNSSSVTVQDTGLRNKSTIDVKDLGPQISWRTVFVVEYLGPLIIHPIFYLLLTRPPSELQTISLLMIMLHFLKREYETLFVHRFSLATMPALNIFKNSAHYWLLAGVNIAFWTYLPSAPTAKAANPVFKYAGVAMFVVGELGNFSNHLTLRDLRKPGSTERGIPKGLGFSLVTCPNYMFETVAWLGILSVNWSLSTAIFAVAAVGQMAVWARKKEMRYRKEFGAEYKRKRFYILPGIY
ncbi:synaptic glyco protein SC2 [Mytilinidion resinicola]|uniref:very-long-chain enoyl-CoA reductase n=1 Tax=Mytilinidion resinicola TaxID=574789 RepID=A0A6A6YL36_9PEZI|nr:synaptic glyco protein SC2 [Mytilinidion resinicola]KAF2808684.1 synaptic glyco protein SC2 [Mytilinidion resinicola]